jgi:hypothetical protein
MSFDFHDKTKIAALVVAGFLGKPYAASYGCNKSYHSCCCDCDGCQRFDQPAGVAFLPPAGVTNSAHSRAIKNALIAAGIYPSKEDRAAKRAGIAGVITEAEADLAEALAELAKMRALVPAYEKDVANAREVLRVAKLSLVCL